MPPSPPAGLLAFSRLAARATGSGSGQRATTAGPDMLQSNYFTGGLSQNKSKEDASSNFHASFLQNSLQHHTKSRPQKWIQDHAMFASFKKQLLKLPYRVTAVSYFSFDTLKYSTMPKR
jgi:hypothetical protein